MAITVPGGGSTVLVFNVTGSAATNYGIDFANANGPGTPVSQLSSGDTESTVTGALNVIFSNSSASTYALSTGSQYTYLGVGGSPVRVDGSTAGGDTVLGGSDFTYVEAPGAGDNRVVFTDGNNIFDGSSIGGAGDTIAGGSGYDTINTGAGPTTVFGGTGHTLINLFDTIAGDSVALLDGNSTVNAFGVSDTVYAAAGATDTVFGGSGSLLFVAGGAVSSTIVGGTGSTTIFGAAGADINYYATSNTSTATIIAGPGNETLHGAGGVEHFTAGSGSDTFDINTVSGGGTISIDNFGASDFVNFAGLSVSDETSLLGTSSTTDGTNLFVTLSDGTQVEFVGVTSLTGHLV